MSSTQEVGDIFGAGKGPAQAMLRSPTVLIVSVGLWGMNLFFFNLFGINYRYVLKHDLLLEREKIRVKREQHRMKTPRRSNADDNSSGGSYASGEHDILLMEDSESMRVVHHEEQSGAAITWYKLVAFSVSLLFVLHFTTHFWIDRLGRSSIGAVFSFYGAVLIYIMLPLPSTKWLRRAFVITLQRSLELIYPRFQSSRKYLRPIPFVDVFYADAMCSMSKVFFDWGMLGHMAAHYPEPVPPNAHNIIIPSVCAAIPYIIRARQCLLMLSIGRMKNDPKRYQHLANAIKYSTSIWPLFLSAYQKTISESQAQKFEGLLIFLLFVNASYSLYWDIVMDWGMMQNPTAAVKTVCGGSTAIYSDLSPGSGSSSPSKGVLGLQQPACYKGLLRPRLRYGVTISACIFLTDCILRFSWMLRFADHIFPSSDSFVLFTQFLEVFRRSLWNLLRVEWENLKQKSSGTRLIQEEEDEDDDEDDDSETAEFLEFSSPVRQRAT